MKFEVNFKCIDTCSFLDVGFLIEKHVGSSSHY